jgi:hypothetical protein
MTRTSKGCIALLGVGLTMVVLSAQERGRGAGPQGQPAQGRGRGPGYLKLFDSNMPYDAHDLAGIWSPNGNGFGGGGRCRDCGDRGYSFEFPEFTPAGKIAFDKNIPSYGRAKDSDDAKAHPEEHIGRRRAQPPALGNDTYGTCNPMGMPRAILYPDPVEFIVLPDRIYQHFEWGYGLRTIWTDGRTLPKPGYDERTWIDYFGYPHSDQMVLHEEYTRTNFDTLELKMTITDPKYYAKPWVGETKRMHLLPKDFIKSSGWPSLLEDLCAPANENEFNRVIRDPAGTGKPPVRR